MRFIFTFIFVAALCGSEVQINEIVSSNQNTFFDEDGDTPDWIELYNSSSNDISILDWGLTDDSSELFGLNYKNSKCNTDGYLPNKYKKTSGCYINSKEPRACFAPQESTRLSNPSNTLRGTGINRWQWLHNDPQEFAIEKFNRIPTNYRMVAKDNHVPLIEIPLSDDNIKPDNNNLNIDPSNNINNWAKGLATHRYAPGNPDGVINYNYACKT